MVFFGEVQNGSIRPLEQNKLASEWVAKKEGKRVRIETSDIDDISQSDINFSYYYGVILPNIQVYFSEMGFKYSIEEIDALTRFKVEPVIITDPETLEDIRIGIPKKSMPENEYVDFIAKVKEYFFKEFRIIFPERPIAGKTTKAKLKRQ